jgi:hypothetical protein
MAKGLIESRQPIDKAAIMDNFSSEEKLMMYIEKLKTIVCVSCSTKFIRYMECHKGDLYSGIQSYVTHLCEDCYDILFKGFMVPLKDDGHDEHIHFYYYVADYGWARNGYYPPVRPVAPMVEIPRIDERLVPEPAFEWANDYHAVPDDDR